MSILPIIDLYNCAQAYLEARPLVRGGVVERKYEHVVDSQSDEGDGPLLTRQGGVTRPLSADTEEQQHRAKMLNKVRSKKALQQNDEELQAKSRVNALNPLHPLKRFLWVFL